MARTKRIGLKLLQYSLVVGTLAWIVTQTEWDRTIDLLARVDLLVLAVVLCATGLEFVCRFSMWNALLNGRRQTHIFTAARIELVIKYVNHLLPSRVAGQSLAPLAIYHYTDHDWSEAVSIAGLSTGLHTILYGAVAVAGLAIFANQLSGGILIVLGLSAGLYVVIGALVLAAGRRLNVISSLAITVGHGLPDVPIIGKRLASLSNRLPSFTANAAAVFQELSSNPWLLSIYLLSWTGTLMVFPGIRVWLLLTTLGKSFTPAVLLPVVLVTAYSVTLLPLTPGGIGVAEASATVVFVALGIPEAVAVPVVLLDRFLGVYLAALLGWIPMLEVDLAELSLDRDQSAGTPPSPDE
ncbi:lysylphosphatidylglycerol synthase transmembrane domain-containing protein [Halococcus sp. PRR34]|uniref:lysylphosphatidylglycerol synthase transmembrane domain-containing protein n=1 Tax=Halococcus sp. PRR34 TaxID=3020830 RepID=UPI002360F71D|nr:lysylphosphatidylglycerol synthase transmembrane domain-containing protein [Halococcus sp. PRR34]